jgi:hypothetical protein
VTVSTYSGAITVKKGKALDFLGDKIWANPQHYQISRTWGHMLTIKFGKSSVGDRDKTEAKSKEIECFGNRVHID